MVPGFFRLTMLFSRMTSSENRMKENGELDVFISCLFCLFMFVGAFTIAIMVVWVYARWNINFALHLRQFIPYGHFHPLSFLNFSRLMKGLNNYNNVTEWDTVETCEKKNFDLFWVPDIFRCVPDIFYPSCLAHGIFLLKINWCAWYFSTLYLWKSVIATF